MSDVEYDCLHSIAMAYALWAVQQRRYPINYLAYMRALGLMV